jgi:hypothetical protein
MPAMMLPMPSVCRMMPVLSSDMPREALNKHQFSALHFFNSCFKTDFYRNPV